MKILRCYSITFVCTIPLILSGQCAFQHISNDTIYQDYIELTDTRANPDEIITIGSRITRGLMDDTYFNAPIFQTFDHCGNVLRKTIYNYVGNYKLRHKPIPTHNTYKKEPIGNTATKINEDEYLIVDKAFDTITKKSALILFKVTMTGEIKYFETRDLDIIESNYFTIKHVLELKNGKILVILWDYLFQYAFYYFDKNLIYSHKKSFSLGRGIRSIKELTDEDYICTSLAYDDFSFQFYKLDTNGEIKWIVTPYTIFGSARELIIEHDKIYVTGGVSYGGKGIFGVFIIADTAGNILKEFIYDSLYCQQRFCNLSIDSSGFYTITGYVAYCQSEDKRSPDISIMCIDTNGSVVWNKLYDFRNALGTTGSQGYYTDYGGFTIAKSMDGSIITSGISVYNRSSQGGQMHENALLIRTEPNIMTQAVNFIYTKNTHFELAGNLVTCDLDIIGPLNLIDNWAIYSSSGKIKLSGKLLLGTINVSKFEPGLYFLSLREKANNKCSFKFVKI